jgi:hypothetical protein
MSTYSPDLRIELITTGTQAGTWGSTTNTNLGTIIEGSIAGYDTVSVTSATQALTALDGTADQARLAMLKLTTTTTANFAVFAPPVSKQYIIWNASAYTATVLNATANNGTSPAGASAVVVSGTRYYVSNVGTTILGQWQTYFSALTVAPSVGDIITCTFGGTVPGTPSLVAAAAVLASNEKLTVFTDGTYFYTVNPKILNSTANGVVYANSGNILTNGTALVFDGTKLGVGASAPAYTLDVLSGTANDAAGTPIARIVGANQVITAESATLSLQSNSNMAIDTGGSIILGGRGTTSSTTAASYGHIAGRKENGTSANFAGYLQIGTSNSSGDITEQVRIDSLGNVGFGLIPSVWETYRALQMGAGAILSTSTNDFRLSQNALRTLNVWQYINNGFANQYQQDGSTGEHKWFTAPSGIAGPTTTITTGQVYTVTTLGPPPSGPYSSLAQWQAFFSALTVLPTVGQTITATATGTLAGGATVTQNITFTQAMTLTVGGDLTVSGAPLVTTTGTQTLTNKTIQGGAITSGTAVTPSGTAVDFTSIPSWVKRITVLFSVVTTSGTDPMLIQLGTSSGVVATGYTSVSSVIGTGVNTLTNTTGFILAPSAAFIVAGHTFSGSFSLNLIGSNIWTLSGTICAPDQPYTYTSTGTKTLAAVLDRVRITTAGTPATNTFNAGTINILYE